MLIKKPSKRMTLNELLKHPWLTSNCESVRTMRENATSGNIFRLNSLTIPLSEDETVKTS